MVALISEGKFIFDEGIEEVAGYGSPSLIYVPKQRKFLFELKLWLCGYCNYVTLKLCGLKHLYGLKLCLFS